MKSRYGRAMEGVRARPARVFGLAGGECCCRHRCWIHPDRDRQGDWELKREGPTLRKLIGQCRSHPGLVVPSEPTGRYPGTGRFHLDSLPILVIPSGLSRIGELIVDRTGNMPQRIAILGSTGSIGRNALRVIDVLGSEYQVVALSARRSVELL